MIEFAASLLKSGIEIIFPILWILIFLQISERKNEISSLMKGIIWGTATAIGLFIIQNKFYRMEFLDVIEKGLLFLSVAASLSLFLFQWRNKSAKEIKGVYFIFSFSYMIDKLPVVFPVIVSQLTIKTGLNGGINSEWIGNVAALTVGILLLFLLGKAIRRIGSKMQIRYVGCFLSFGYLFLLFIQSIELLQILFGLRILPLTMWVLNFLIPFVNYKEWFFYGEFAVIFLFMFFMVKDVRRGIQTKDYILNNTAEKRKGLAVKRNTRRWLYSSVSIMIVIISIISGNQVLTAQTFSEKPPITVQAQKGHIYINKDELKLRTLYKYSYSLPDGTNVRFLVIRKTQKNDGVALDACQICGIAGYYQKGDQIICRKCQSIININTIGFKGGCNPIASIEYKYANNGLLDIPVSTLNKAKKIFQEGSGS